MHRFSLIILLISIILGGIYYWNYFRLNTYSRVDIFREAQPTSSMEVKKVNGPIKTFPPIRIEEELAMQLIEVAAQSPTEISIKNQAGQEVGIREFDESEKITWISLLNAPNGRYELSINTEKGEPYSVAVYGTNTEGITQTKLLEGVSREPSQLYRFVYNASSSADIITIQE
ncbi:hypothetical protein A3H80_02130 [Candidatus Roizmanbacteria bacterium RIFCSPLOWO2_02_FULL_37_19]|uniref:Uncharacterized protein n=1 Tax=Candidatus Roizmanbacteria bacterium RIFCSPHIGHO2_02_FULL_37_24 TaxID=1802037 RepID=A0A1F7GZW5_9BACT|nr:MAG: hypothetical protein A2862_02715 [Candidatus Roizmanbacteria bacterium RIFCSPHIGHO2_01_FULL_38_41]OGK24531.1 MAG: hypothetical protein A3C24_03210 [Candidatus Roizmanbacteria bacterium RIFCSPHIGHO2_02_FULL_37_24]OGK31985.1 MAG: hypothetical protein A3E10_04550 [Candidatus Roizmanbacteria bacterium RIFCSPHIGHO2_12_FULL_37_23]OGK43786.1 MAG: hypothetical protein A2956_04675 [Candidatus Roizmanbacteria bacterium RIFCSPLOWO2_01_FULL_37_57]OGK54340.1 MAG: hypothetical protein A3H80_02130 [Ca